ncbi:MAG: glycoside hydrolase family 5 protein [Oscillospiraceae bacterium]|jgi:endoglucanase|nr:glycoside hydrolase family 5 protein [Oscillospiraceae bacterium]
MSIFRKLSIVVIILTIVLSLVLLNGCSDPLKDVTSLELARMMGYGINLGNTMEACDSGNRIPNRDPSVYETMWGNPITTQAMVTGMKEAGFKTLRIPVAWTNAMDFENGDFTINEAYLDRVGEIINYALNEDMFVVINWHWDHGWWSLFGHPEMEKRELAMEIFTQGWTQIANKYKGIDLRLIFEPSNEEWGNRFNDRTPFSPTGGTLNMDERYELITELGQVFIDLVRDTGGNNSERFLLAKGFNTDIMMTMDDRFELPNDPKNKLLLSVHYYTPWGYCGDNASVETWGRLNEVEEMNRLLGMLSKFTDEGVGVFLGEWGVLDNIGEDRLFFFKNFLDNCDLYGFVPMLWDTGWVENFGGRGLVFDRVYTQTIVPPEVLELFQSRSVDSRKHLTTDDIVEAARASMAVALQVAADRPEFILEADEAIAWIMYTSGDWNVQYSVGDRFRPESITRGVEPTDVFVTGPGTYTVALDFTETADGFADGFAFSAVGIMNGEILFPGYYMEITELLINGVQATYEGIPYTTNDNPVTTRVNLYNEWVDNVPEEARVLSGNIEDASPIFLENYRLTQIKTISVTFEYIEP